MMKLLLAGVIAVAGLAGCSTLTFEDGQSDQPWLSPGSQSTGVAEIAIRGVGQRHSLRWIGPDGTTYQASDVMKQANEYLSKGSRQHHLMNLLGIDPTEYPKRIQLHIVSLDPLLIVATPFFDFLLPPHYTGSHLYPSYGMILVTPYESNAEVGTNRYAHVLLPAPYAYGTRIQLREPLVWFSPTMSIEPERLTTGQVDGHGYEIATPWGSLVLRREGDEVTVSARNTGTQ